jgi:hypothetical protein
VLTVFYVLSPYTCHFILQISDQNSLTGTISTEFGMMTLLKSFQICKLSLFAFPGFARARSSWSAYQSFSSWLGVLTIIMFCRLTCQCISGDNSLTGTIPTEIGMMTSLALLFARKLSSFAFRGLRPCWDFLPYTCHFILQISDQNTLTGTIPSEIGMLTSLTSLKIGKLSSNAFRCLRPCWFFLERIPIIFQLVYYGPCAVSNVWILPFVYYYHSYSQQRSLWDNSGGA